MADGSGGAPTRAERRSFVFGGLGLMMVVVVLARTHVFQVERQYRVDPVESVQVNVNTADSATLSLLGKIGPERARRIVDHRAKNGPFRSYPDLMRVSGIGRKTVEDLVGRVSFGLPE